MFEVFEGDPASPVVLHVPHAGMAIPSEVRADLVLDDQELAAELQAMTDARTDAVAERAAQQAGKQPWRFVNGLSRLVIDPERFPDEREEMRGVGMGAVYTQTSDGAVLRREDPAAQRELLTAYFEPYAAALTDVVAQRLDRLGRVVIIDVHSYPRKPLPYELHADLRRPAVCLGVDDHHTPPVLASAARAAFATIGEVVVNEPFAGAYVPLRWYGTDRRVASIMIELRRDTYLDETSGAPHDGQELVAAALSRLVDAAT